MLSFLTAPKNEPRLLSPEIIERRDRTYAYMQRIQDALQEAGFDPEMLNQLPPGHIAAALALGVK
jgi:uncharacterized protein YbaP (TraB family)